MADVLLDALLDTLKVFPFLFILYEIIELIEHKTEIIGSKNRLNGKLGPLIGSATGLIPQCGFSVMAAKLYESDFIGLGTLISIFISTSDEAFIILLSEGDAMTILYIIVVKILFGVSIGYLLNAVFRGNGNMQVSTVADYQREKAKDYRSKVYEKKFEYTSCGRSHSEGHPVKTYLLSPLLHSLKIAAYVLAVNVVFGTLIYFIGEERISAFLEKSVWVQPFITALVGLIPNCASSVVVTETYLIGGIRFGSMLAGLCTNAGLGLVVLLKNTKMWKRNLFIVFLMYVFGVLIGSLINGLLWFIL